VLELWGLGDLVIATPFLQAASEKFTVTLLAKPFATELRPRLWPAVTVVPFVAPWTAFAFSAKYNLWNWPWRELLRLRRRLAAEQFTHGLSARWDPRDHALMRAAGVQARFGIPRLNSAVLLTHPLPLPDRLAHHYEHWRTAGRALGLTLPTRQQLVPPLRPPSRQVLLHSGARLPARVWPLENFRQLAARLRAKNIAVQIACDADQLGWWLDQGENAASPHNVAELLAQIDRAGAFFGNCSGPGHLAAICGVPTFTVYGPSLHEWFAPLHPAAEIFEGKACPYKPCADYCRLAEPVCLRNITAAEVWPRVEKFVEKHLERSAGR
jgi:heptosyltransferase-2